MYLLCNLPALVLWDRRWSLRLRSIIDINAQRSDTASGRFSFALRYRPFGSWASNRGDLSRDAPVCAAGWSILPCDSLAG